MENRRKQSAHFFLEPRIEYYDSVCFLSARDALENLISRKTEGRSRCQNFPTHREVNTADRKNTLA